uniref:Uncharacterized protein n=1 Tax=Haptolina brevifila TaxID=156173 RepID=A0A7S2C4L1_9EUKA|mmetsp:Transcript_20294/g.41291  ORF Transcript_20294/g.41291 Transcript_20294/m.41291 type:complete len:155 (+) Transcript_20294:473-937(+)
MAIWPRIQPVLDRLAQRLGQSSTLVVLGAALAAYPYSATFVVGATLLRFGCSASGLRNAAAALTEQASVARKGASVACGHASATCERASAECQRALAELCARYAALRGLAGLKASQVEWAWRSYWLKLQSTVQRVSGATQADYGSGATSPHALV